MNFSSLFMLRQTIKTLLLIVLIPCLLNAMEPEEGNSSMHNQSHIFSNRFQIRAVAKFQTLNHTEKDFARYIVPRSISHDDQGNVQTVDVLNISIKTDKHSPMFNVKVIPRAVNILMKQMKLACTTFNEYNPDQSVTTEMMIPLDEDFSAKLLLGLMDETGKHVVLSIEKKAQ